MIIRSSVIALLACTLSVQSFAQCPGQWVSFPGIPEVTNCLHVWTPPAAGSQPTRPLLVMNGLYRIGPTSAYTRLVTWDGANWGTLGGDLSTGYARAMCTMPNGDLVIGGEFTMVGGVAATNLARWNGSQWSSLQTGTMGVSNINALAVLPNGDLIAGGSFDTIGGLPIKCIARWDGTNWHSLGIGFGTSRMPVYALTVLPSGDLVVGGRFTHAGGDNSIRNVATWHPATESWSPMGTGTNGDVWGLTVLPDGTPVAVGLFTRAGSLNVNYMASWGGEDWVRWPLGADDLMVSVLALPGGDLVAGGYFSAIGGVSANGIARWNHLTGAWSAFGVGIDNSSGTDYVQAIALMPGPGGPELFIGGGFYGAGGQSARGLCRWVTRPACVADFDCSGNLSPQDIFSYLDAWFTGDLLGDFDGNGTVAVMDIFDCLTAWFTGCP